MWTHLRSHMDCLQRPLISDKLSSFDISYAFLRFGWIHLQALVYISLSDKWRTHENSDEVEVAYRMQYTVRRSNIWSIYDEFYLSFTDFESYFSQGFSRRKDPAFPTYWTHSLESWISDRSTGFLGYYIPYIGHSISVQICDHRILWFAICGISYASSQGCHYSCVIWVIWRSRWRPS